MKNPDFYFMFMINVVDFQPSLSSTANSKTVFPSAITALVVDNIRKSLNKSLFEKNSGASVFCI